MNADSLTDIGVAAAREYWEAIKHRTSTLLSINHEANEFTVAELIREAKDIARLTRAPCPMRRDYTEELVEITVPPQGASCSRRRDDCHQFGNWLQGMAVMP